MFEVSRSLWENTASHQAQCKPQEERTNICQAAAATHPCPPPEVNSMMPNSHGKLEDSTEWSPKQMRCFTPWVPWEDEDKPRQFKYSHLESSFLSFEYFGCNKLLISALIRHLVSLNANWWFIFRSHQALHCKESNFLKSSQQKETKQRWNPH